MSQASLLSLRTNFLLKISFVICFLNQVTADDIVVNTRFGSTRGRVHKSPTGSICTFKNIPFAKQPIGDLRFKLPTRIEPWDAIDSLNYEDAIYCPQVLSSYIRSSEEELLGQEDCLFLDIYKRKGENISLEALPVLIYFHPGRFSYGSKEEFSSEFLLEFNDIIVVIPNYRLGIFGFISKQNSSLPGNLGLWDQRMAMEWVYENIESFGGNPEKITIAGHDAGGASVGFHILSPLSHKYFSAAISVSGTALDPWSMSSNPDNAIILEPSLECNLSYEDDTATCLKEYEMKEILKIQAKLDDSKFRPIVDNVAEVPFLPIHPISLYERGYQKDVTYLTGLIQEEALAEVSREFPTAVKYQHLDKIIEYLLSPYLKEMHNFPLIVKATKYHYLRGVPVPTYESIKTPMVEMMSDFLYNSPLLTTLKWHSKKTTNTFMYVLNDKKKGMQDVSFNLGHSSNAFDDIHIGDASLIFNTTIMNAQVSNTSESELQIRRTLLKIWGNFIAKKIPLFENWKTFSEKNMNYIEISSKVEAKYSYKKSNSELWTFLLPDLEKIHNSSIASASLKKEILKKGTAESWGITGLTLLLGILCISLVGVVIVTRRTFTHLSIIPTHKEEIKYSNIA